MTSIYIDIYLAPKLKTSWLQVDDEIHAIINSQHICAKS